VVTDKRMPTLLPYIESDGARFRLTPARDEWKNDLSAIINAGIGEITIIVPENVGVKVHVTGFLGSVDTPGYNKKGKEYTNNLWGKTKYNLEFKIKGAIGTIDIKEK